jgi:hypothetical protein
MDTLLRTSSPFYESPSPSSPDKKDEDEVMTSSPNRQIPTNKDVDVDLDEDELWEQLQTQYGSCATQLPPQSNQLANDEIIPFLPLTASPPSPHTSTDIPPTPDTATHQPGEMPSKLASGDILTLQNGIAPTNAIWSSQDLSLLRIYKACDDAGAPRYLPDKLMTLF